MGSTLERLRSARSVRQRQRIAAAAAPAVLVVTYPIFQLTDRALGDRVEGYLGWAAGLAIYWLLWGVLFSLWMVGRDGLRRLIRPRRRDRQMILLAAVPAVVAGIGRLSMEGVAYHPPSRAVLFLLLGTAIGNGFFEEVLWRGVYLDLFKDRFFGVVWPSVWFGLSHLAPASVAVDGDAISLVAGAVVLGFYQAYLARRSNSVFWPIVAHTCAGLVIVF